MKRSTVLLFALLFSMSCTAPEKTPVAVKNTNGANASPAGNTNVAAAKPKFFSAVYALKGNRMPDDAKLAEQQRDFRHALTVNIEVSSGDVDSLNWDEKFKDPVNLKLKEGEHVLVITFASPAGKKLQKGIYEATEETDSVDKAPKDKSLAIITLIDSTGARRLKGKVNVSDAGNIIMYSFDERPNAPGLDSMSYGAPLKN